MSSVRHRCAIDGCKDRGDVKGAEALFGVHQLRSKHLGKRLGDVHVCRHHLGGIVERVHHPDTLRPSENVHVVTSKCTLCQKQVALNRPSCEKCHHKDVAGPCVIKNFLWNFVHSIERQNCAIQRFYCKDCAIFMEERLYKKIDMFDYPMSRSLISLTAQWITGGGPKLQRVVCCVYKCDRYVPAREVCSPLQSSAVVQLKNTAQGQPLADLAFCAPHTAQHMANHRRESTAAHAISTACCLCNTKVILSNDNCVTHRLVKGNTTVVPICHEVLDADQCLEKVKEVGERTVHVCVECLAAATSWTSMCCSKCNKSFISASGRREHEKVCSKTQQLPSTSQDAQTTADTILQTEEYHHETANLTAAQRRQGGIHAIRQHRQAILQDRCELRGGGGDEEKPQRVNCAVHGCSSKTASNSTNSVAQLATVIRLKWTMKDTQLTDCYLCASHRSQCQQQQCPSPMEEEQQTVSLACICCTNSLVLSRKWCPRHLFKLPNSAVFVVPCEHHVDADTYENIVRNRKKMLAYGCGTCDPVAAQEKVEARRRRDRERYEKESSPIRRRMRDTYATDSSPRKRRMRETYAADSSPTKRRIREKYAADPSPDKQRHRRTYAADSSPRKRRMRETYAADSAPTKRRIRKKYAADPSPDKQRHRRTYAADSSPIKRRIREKYEADPSPDKQRHRRTYAADSSPIKRRIQEKYEADPSPDKQRHRQTYAADRSPIKRRMRDRYAADSSPAKQQKRVAYAADPSPTKVRMRDSYAADSSAVRQRMREQYAANADRTKQRMKMRRALLVGANADHQRNFYLLHKRRIHHAIQMLFMVSHRQHKLNSKRTSAAKRPTPLVKWQRRVVQSAAELKRSTRLKASESAIHHMAEDAASNPDVAIRLGINRRYAVAAVHKALLVVRSRTIVETNFDNEEKVVNRLRGYCRSMWEQYQSAKKAIAQAAANTAAEKIAVLTEQYGGEQEHMRSQQPYSFYVAEKKRLLRMKTKALKSGDTTHVSAIELALDCLHDCGAIVADEADGKVQNTSCNPKTCRYPSDWPARLNLFLSNLHPEQATDTLCQMLVNCEDCESCRRSYCDKDIDCSNVLEMLRELAPHYRTIRTLLRQYYYVRECNIWRIKFWQAVRYGDSEMLVELHENLPRGIAEKKTDDADVSGPVRPAIDEQTLIETHRKAIAQFCEDISDVRDTECSCCHMLQPPRKLLTIVAESDDSDSVTLNHYKLCRRVDGDEEDEDEDDQQVVQHPSAPKTSRGRKRKPVVVPLDYWQMFLTECHISAADNIVLCTDQCFADVKKHAVPLLSRWNYVDVDSVPREIARLNRIERLLISPAQTFMTIIRLQPHLKNLPNRMKMKAMRGIAIHLPIPVNETLEKVRHTLPAIDATHIVVQGLPPTKPKSEIFRNYVNMRHIKAAILKLKALKNRFFDNIAFSVDGAEINEAVSCEEANEPMLTQTLPTNMEEYSVKEMWTAKPNVQDTKIYQQKRISDKPISEKTAELDVQCFPHLFPTGRFGMNVPKLVRPNDVSNRLFIKHKLFHKDSRFRRDAPYLFFLQNMKDLRAIDQGIYATMNTTGFPMLSKAELIEKIRKNDEEVNVRLNAMMSKLIGSPGYWGLRNGDMKALDEAFGPATFFLSLSCAEFRWPDMLVALKAANPDLAANIDDIPLRELCGIDPVTVVEQFYRRWRALLNVMTNKSGGPLGLVKHYVWRVEMQDRGAPHIHMKLWIEGAPTLGKDSDDEVKAFILRHVTCQLPDQSTDPILHNLVKTYQMHKCTKSCLRRKKTSKTWTTFCRYGFPRKTANTIALRSGETVVQRRKFGRREKVYTLPRTNDEKCVNDFNPTLLLLWKANMDIQYIGEHSQLLNNYITSYISKAEHDVAEDIWNAVDLAGKTTAGKLKSYALHCLKTRETGVAETAIRLLSLQLYSFSDHVYWINTNLPDRRRRRLKDMDTLLEETPNASAFYSNLTDNYYPNRGDALENVCLYDIAQNYSYFARACRTKCRCCFRMASGDGCFRRRQKPQVIKTQTFTAKEETKEQLYHQLLVLFKPFRIEEMDLLAGHADYETAFVEAEDLLDPLYQQFRGGREKMRQMLELKAALTTVNAAETSPPSSQTAQMVPAQDLQTIVDAVISEAQLQQMVESCTKEQRQVFDMVTNHFSQMSTTEPLRLFVSGVGGTGKSFLIKLLRSYLQHKFGLSKAVAVSAPTGIAAHNISGVTNHRLFNLPIQRDTTTHYQPLETQKLKEMRAEMRDLQLIIIDEISMVANVTLAMIEMRMSEVFPSKGPFGGCNILVLGDLLQLGPVGAQGWSRTCGYVFEELKREHAKKAFATACCIDRKLWSAFDYIELTTNKRQEGDSRYAELLNRVRLANTTVDDISLLQTRVFTPADATQTEKLQVAAERFEQLTNANEQPLCLFAKVLDTDNFNDVMLSRGNFQLHTIVAIDLNTRTNKSVKTGKTQKQRDKVSDRAGLETILKIGVGCRVMLRRNLDMEMGLVNGALGTVDAVYLNSDTNVVTQIAVRFDGFDGEAYNVCRISVDFELSAGVYVTRQQFPLILAYGVTVHKCQGLSLNSAIIDIGPSVFAEGQAYVALSRVKRLEGVHLVDFNPLVIQVDRRVITEYNKLRSRSTLPLAPLPMPLAAIKARKKAPPQQPPAATPRGSAATPMEITINSRLSSPPTKRVYSGQQNLSWKSIVPWDLMAQQTPMQAATTLVAPRQDLNSKVALLKGDITQLDTDCIVNAAKRSLLGGAGVDGAIHAAAGPKLKVECGLVAPCDTGDAKITSAYQLPSRFVIHTVGPLGSDANREQLLAQCYMNSLCLAASRHLTTIAFPSISTGVYNFPLELATKIALRTTRQWLEESKNATTMVLIVFVVFSDNDHAAYVKLMSKYFPAAQTTSAVAVTAVQPTLPKLPDVAPTRSQIDPTISIATCSLAEMRAVVPKWGTVGTVHSCTMDNYLSILALSALHDQTFLDFLRTGFTDAEGALVACIETMIRRMPDTARLQFIETIGRETEIRGGKYYLYGSEMQHGLLGKLRHVWQLVDVYECQNSACPGGGPYYQCRGTIYISDQELDLSTANRQDPQHCGRSSTMTARCRGNLTYRESLFRRDASPEEGLNSESAFLVLENAVLPAERYEETPKYILFGLRRFRRAGVTFNYNDHFTAAIWPTETSSALYYDGNSAQKLTTDVRLPAEKVLCLVIYVRME